MLTKPGDSNRSPADIEWDSAAQQQGKQHPGAKGVAMETWGSRVECIKASDSLFPLRIQKPIPHSYRHALHVMTGRSTGEWD